MKRHAALVGTFVILALAGCARAPEATVDRARQAVAEARSGQADVYAPDALAGALALEEQMDRELAAQARRAGFLRRWDSAERLAARTAEAALAATGDAAAAREELKLQLEPELPALRDAIPVASDLVTRAASVRGVRMDAAGLSAEIEAIGALVADALRAYQSERYRDAANLATEAKHRLDGVQRTIQEALNGARKS